MFSPVEAGLLKSPGESSGTLSMTTTCNEFTEMKITTQKTSKYTAMLYQHPDATWQ